MQIVIDTTQPLGETETEILRVLLGNHKRARIEDRIAQEMSVVPDLAPGGSFESEGLTVVGEDSGEETDDKPKRKRRSRCKDCGELHFPDEACETEDSSPASVAVDGDSDGEPEADPTEAEGPVEADAGEATVEDAVQRAVALITDGHKAEVRAALQKIGVKKVSEIPADKVAGFLADLGSIES